MTTAMAEARDISENGIGRDGGGRLLQKYVGQQGRQQGDTLIWKRRWWIRGKAGTATGEIQDGGYGGFQRQAT